MELKQKDKEMIKNSMALKKVTPRGGYRPGAGRPRKSKNNLTLKAENKEKTAKERILKKVDSLINAQISLAQGQHYLYEITITNVGNRKKPVHTLVTNPKTIKQYLDGDLDEERFFYITTEKPDNRAIDSLLDRALGKPDKSDQKEQNFNFNILNYQNKEKVEELPEGPNIIDIQDEN